MNCKTMVMKVTEVCFKVRLWRVLKFPVTRPRLESDVPWIQVKNVALKGNECHPHYTHPYNRRVIFWRVSEGSCEYRFSCRPSVHRGCLSAHSSVYFVKWKRGLVSLNASTVFLFQEPWDTQMWVFQRLERQKHWLSCFMYTAESFGFLLFLVLVE